MKRIVLLLGVLTLSLAGCQTAEKRDYDSLIRKNTEAKKVYSGFHAAFEAHVTNRTREVNQGILEQTAKFRGWDDATLQLEIKKANDKHLTESRFYLRFFAPEADYDDLHKPNSIWKVYLVVNGQKYDAKITKDFGKLVEIQTLYTHFDRFSTGYELVFPIGRPSLEGQPYTIWLTSSLGQAEFKF